MRRLKKRKKPAKARNWKELDILHAQAMREKRLSFYKTNNWITLRTTVYGLYGSRCMKCGSYKEEGNIANVDHIKCRKLFPELELDIRNLQVLCSTCNKNKSNYNSIDYRKRYTLRVVKKLSCQNQPS